MVKYNGQISDNIRKLYTKNPLTSFDKDKTTADNKEWIKNSGLNKKIGAPTAVHIAAAISSYARMIIN